ncbi:unnamed protein product [Dovyalis caffra]|uniref:Zinc finger-XS domain-containing protein n=1 Tax=Dovyalis caffra TaxID=77055 RepID=A0AAV1RRR6_9ROSI|nr:unnamed protein product [Dovyalis caffra]
MSNMKGNISDEETDFSESEIDGFIEKLCERLKAGKHTVKNPNATFRCPFCVGKKKQEYSFCELLQHASAVGVVGSSHRSGKEKASHLALAKYLGENPADEYSRSEDPKFKPGKLSEQLKQEKLYAWPWKGIKPVEVNGLRDEENLKWYVTVGFADDMTGYENVVRLDTDFEVILHDDYSSKGVIGTYLHANTKLYTISNMEEKSMEERSMMLTSLEKELEISTNTSLYEMQYKYNEKSVSE